MKRLLVSLITVLIVFAFPGTGSPETVVYVYGGQVHTRPHQLTVSQPPLGNYLVFDHAEFRDESYGGPIYYGFRVSHFFKDHPRLGVEVEFFHPKAILEHDKSSRVTGIYHGGTVDEIAKVDKYVRSWEVSHGFNMLLANVAYRYGFFKTEKVPYGRLQLVARAGMGPTLLHPESIVDHQKYYTEKGGYEFGDLGFQLSPGIEFNIYQGLNAFAEYKYTYTEIDHVTVKFGEARTVFESDHLAFGLAYHFQ